MSTPLSGTGSATGAWRRLRRRFRRLAGMLAARGYRLQAGPTTGTAPGVPTLHLEIDAWEASLPQRVVSLQARWTLAVAPPPPDRHVGSASAAATTVPPTRGGELRLQLPWHEATPAGLVAAQRDLLRALSQGIADGIGQAPGL